MKKRIIQINLVCALLTVGCISPEHSPAWAWIAALAWLAISVCLLNRIEAEKSKKRQTCREKADNN